MTKEDIEIDRKVLASFYDVISESKIEMFDRIASERTKFITIVLENIHQEHNASAVLRSCDCFGLKELHVIEKDNQYKVQRDIARGAGRWVDLFNYNEGTNPSKDCVEKLKKRGFKIVSTSPHATHSIADIDISTPTAFVFGTEGEGISQEMIDMSDELVKIPMFGFTESFNISVSVALTLSKIRERLSSSDIPFRLTEHEQILQKIKWSTKILRSGKEMEQVYRNRALEEFPKEQ
jgi:tRNA (guanosine-2'-O-)-methyltransferase